MTSLLERRAHAIGANFSPSRAVFNLSIRNPGPPEEAHFPGANFLAPPSAGCRSRSVMFPL
jgi:hypothetical protein